uniref:Putative secreted protein n=1 Tax=Anopheles darlingi TaxID=43151 RepID=A0A2M4DEC0_ANODA
MFFCHICLSRVFRFLLMSCLGMGPGGFGEDLRPALASRSALTFPAIWECPGTQPKVIFLFEPIVCGICCTIECLASLFSTACSTLAESVKMIVGSFPPSSAANSIPIASAVNIERLCGFVVLCSSCICL